MFREIKKKQIILENRKPYSSETGEYIRELNKLDWIHSSMRLDGSIISRPEAEKILRGGFVAEASLDDHVLIERYSDLINTANDMLAMSNTLNREMISAFSQKLAGKPDDTYRRGNPVLLSIGYNPPHPSEIDEQMEILMNWFYSDDMEENPVLKAACLHSRLIEVYPFETYSEAAARAAMYFYLMEKGYPAFEIRMKENEYNLALIEYLKKENIEPFYREIERCIFNKMEVLIQLTAGDGGVGFE